MSLNNFQCPDITMLIGSNIFKRLFHFVMKNNPFSIHLHQERTSVLFFAESWAHFEKRSIVRRITLMLSRNDILLSIRVAICLLPQSHLESFKIFWWKIFCFVHLMDFYSSDMDMIRVGDNQATTGDH
jgi:hypothetical protein